MNKKLLLVLAVLTFSSLACNLSFNVPTIKTGPEKTEKIKESLPDNKDEIQVDLSIGAAELKCHRRRSRPGKWNGQIQCAFLEAICLF